MIEKLNDIIIGLKDDLLHLLPKIIMAIIIVGIGYLLGRFVKYLIIKLVRHIGNLAGQKYGNINMKQSAKFIGSVFFWIILLLSFILAADVLGLSIITKWMESILKYSPNVLAAIVIISVAIIFGKFIAGAISSLGEQIGLDHANTLGRIAQYLILLTAIIIAIDQIGFEVMFLVNILNIILACSLLAAALAFGLGARTSVSNILASFYVRKRYKVGDIVKIGEIKGRIIKIDTTLVVMETETGQFSIPAKEFNENKSCLIKKK